MFHVIQLDLTIRSSSSPTFCASSEYKQKGKSKLFWNSCFQNSDHLYTWKMTNNTIQSTTHPEKCWFIKNLKKASNQAIFLKNCNEADQRQQFYVENGMIWLIHKEADEKRFCVVFEENERIRTRRCHDSFLG